MSYGNLIEIPPGTIIPPGQSITTTQAPQFNVNSNAIPIVKPLGLAWPENQALSNGLYSRSVTGAAGINDFTIVNPYIHYDNTQSVIQFNPMSLLELATQRFNIYSSQYRN
jgi:hypothetical protein